MGLADYFGGSSQAKAANKAAKRYIEYQERERNKFLDQPESQSIRSRLAQYMQGGSGYSPEVLSDMRSGVAEDYGRGLRDFKRNIPKTGVMGGGVYAPGQMSRSARLLQENLSARRAETNRAITRENEDLARDNERWAASVYPTYAPGLPATPQIPYQVFQDRYAQGPSVGELLGGFGDMAIAGGMAYAGAGLSNSALGVGPGQAGYTNPIMAGVYGAGSQYGRGRGGSYY